MALCSYLNDLDLYTPPPFVDNSNCAIGTDFIVIELVDVL